MAFTKVVPNGLNAAQGRLEHSGMASTVSALYAKTLALLNRKKNPALHSAPTAGKER